MIGAFGQKQMHYKDEILMVDHVEEDDNVVQLDVTKKNPNGHQSIDWTINDQCCQKGLSVSVVQLEKEQQNLNVLSTDFEIFF